MTSLPTPAYDFLSPPKIVFGWGRRAEVGRLASSLGRRAWIISGSRTLAASGAIDEIGSALRAAGIAVGELAAIADEPQVADVDRAVEQLRQLNAGPGDFLLAIGGGSAIDLAKAAAALATNHAGRSVVDYLEGVGRGLAIVEPPLPLLAMPTTGGTGAEATKNAVISCYDPPFKKSLRSELMLPRIVLIDPELAVSLPPRATAWSGMDALTQLIESYLSRFARPLPRALAIDGLRRAVPALPEAVRTGTSRWAREAMAQAALLSGLSLANSGLGLAHGVAAALGVHARVTHGLACAVMLPAALRVNRSKCEGELAALARDVLGGRWPSDAAAADAFLQAIDELAATVGVPRRLSELGVRREQIPDLVASSRGNSMNGNPRQLDDAELADVLEQML
ncbi:MAG TPA: iron-containing alcohol dehydrogenase [Pirellulales bacterium]|nr:iron-containing alcohol dehydrogenase [Pirellulales bacterium]